MGTLLALVGGTLALLRPGRRDGKLTDAGRTMFTAVARAVLGALLPQATAALQGMRESSLALRQQAFHALRDISNGSYFADSSTWRAIGYPGPRVL